MYYGFMVFVDNQYLESGFQNDLYEPTAGPRPVNFKYSIIGIFDVACQY